jgi:5'(3')-deoxyribonucleotidase
MKDLVILSDGLTPKLMSLTKETIEQLGFDDFDPLLKLIIPKRGNRPTIHHYSSVVGLKGMIDSDVLHASNAFFLNDSSEVKHGLEMLRSRLVERLPISADRSYGQKILAAIIERMFTSPEEIADAYVVCFSKKGDLLSQWRAYGKSETCYSVALSVRRLWSLTIPFVYIAPVVYSPKKKLALIDAMIDGATRTIDRFDFSSIDIDTATFRELIMHLSFPLLVTTMFIKHEAFEEESEWRLVYIPFLTEEDERVPIELKTRSGTVLPYVSVKVKDAKGNADTLPIKEIRVGPTQDPLIAVYGVRQLLRSKKRTNVEVTKSETPLR